MEFNCKRAIIYGLLFLSLISFHYSFADSTNVSLKSIWQSPQLPDSTRFKALAEYYIRNNQAQPDSTLMVLNYYEKLAKEKNNKKELYHVANDRGGIYRLKGETEKAMRYYKEAESLAVSLNDSSLIATVLGNLGNVYAGLNDYKSAIQHFHKAYTIFKRIGDRNGESHMLMSMGTIYLNIKDYDVAVEYYKEAQAIFQQVDVPERRKAVVYLNLGWIKYDQKKWDEAIVEYERALKILKKSNDKFFLVNCYSTLAKIYMEKKDSKKAKFYAEANDQLSRELNVFDFKMESRTIFARLELLKGNFEKARKEGESILAELNASASKELKLPLYDLLYTCYQAEKNPEKSLKMFQLYTACKDSIQMDVNELNVIREAMKIQFTDILEEKRMKYENEKVLQASIFRRNLFLLLGILVIFLVAVGFYLNKNLQAGRKKREELLEELTRLKTKEASGLVLPSIEFQLNREKIENAIDRKLNDTDWNVLNILLKEPDISNKEIADKAFMSVDGIGSSLRRMYVYFDIKESKYKKIALITEAIRASGNSYSEA